MTGIHLRIGAALAAGCLPTGVALTASCAAQDKPDRNWIKDLRKTPATGNHPDTAAADAAQGVAPPGAGGRTFATLDAYLAYLEAYAAPMDRPWYQEVRPGLFRLATGNLKPAPNAAPPPRLFTHDELERRFGFRK